MFLFVLYGHSWHSNTTGGRGTFPSGIFSFENLVSSATPIASDSLKCFKFSASFSVDGLLLQVLNSFCLQKFCLSPVFNFYLDFSSLFFKSPFLPFFLLLYDSFLLNGKSSSFSMACFFISISSLFVFIDMLYQITESF
eukprot:TRINITY_DN37828_c0_g1_i1.p1 TRINITY_DN37828_c0_g1~~TRINITY_DN37828_c0_g1_i1.p1  ORF type:complete len:139 (-),score=7.27 TRINITY_DN37828_c0_g1_i1:389-805(-)